MPTCKQKWRTYILPTPPETYGTTFLKNGHRKFCRFFSPLVLAFYRLLAPLGARCHIPDVCCWPAAGLGSSSALIAKKRDVDLKSSRRTQKHHPPNKKNKWKLEIFFGQSFFPQEKKHIFVFEPVSLQSFFGKNDLNKIDVPYISERQRFLREQGVTAISRTLNFENTSDGEEISKFTPPTRLMEEGPHLTRKLKTVSGRAAYEDVFLSLHNP